MNRICKNLVAMGLGTLVSLAMLEIGVRMMSTILGVSPYMRYDRELGWTAKQGATKVHKNRYDGFDVTYKINAQGFRGPSYARKKPSGIFRIVVIGDSNGFGWGIPENQHFASILDAELSDTQVINLSLSGYGTDQEYIRFVREGLEFRPDLVLLQVTENDCEEILHPFFNQKPKPYFVFGNKGLELQNVPVKAMGPMSDAYEARSLPLPFKEWLDWHSFLYHYLNQKYIALSQNSVAPEEQTGKEKLWCTPAGIRLLKAIISKLKDKLDETSTAGLVFHASKELSRSGYLDNTSLPVIDLYPVLSRTAALEGVNTFYRDGIHWTPRGHRIIADELMRVLRKGQYMRE